MELTILLSCDEWDLVFQFILQRRNKIQEYRSLTYHLSLENSE